MATTTRYVYDGFQYLGETDENNSPTQRYVNEPDEYTHLIGQHDVAADEDRFFHYDAIGSTREATDETETVTDEVTYDSWGNILARTGMNHAPFQYVGKHGYYLDDLTKSHYVMTRTYISNISRWLSIDPIRHEGGMNIYAYTLNHPANAIDPSGYISIEDVRVGLAQYSCNCGWIDWTHATGGPEKVLRSTLMNELGPVSERGGGFKVIYNQGQGVGGLKLQDVERTYFVKNKGRLNWRTKYSIGLAMVKEVSEAFELMQGGNPISKHSSFSEEDLPSDLIAFYRGFHTSTFNSGGGAKDDATLKVRQICGAISIKDSVNLWKAGGSPSRYIGQPWLGTHWQARDHNKLTPCCKGALIWPKEFRQYKPAKMDNTRHFVDFRYWTVRHISVARAIWDGGGRPTTDETIIINIPPR